ncbi:MAG: hypothetical protein P4L33_15695 [Capsulimonadaceae bacterium]|nr:hypothetical protein [Capsulimonadaceae bacterium]
MLVIFVVVISIATGQTKLPWRAIALTGSPSASTTVYGDGHCALDAFSALVASGTAAQVVLGNGTLSASNPFDACGAAASAQAAAETYAAAQASSAEAAAQAYASGLVSALTPAAIGAEAGLGNPSTDGYLLSSTASGTRSWVAPSSGGSGGGITALTGDISASGSGSVTATLATVNSNVGTFGSASAVPVVAVNGKGLVTGATTATITPSAIGAEPGLGNPSTSGYVLSSTTGGTRSWVAQAAGGSGITALTGDISASGSGSVTATLSTVNPDVGTFGSSSIVPVATVNGKGLVTGVTTATITPSAIGAEPGLGNPSTNGYMLSSTTGGTRSWVAPPSGGGPAAAEVYLAEGYNFTQSMAIVQSYGYSPLEVTLPAAGWYLVEVELNLYMGSNSGDMLYFELYNVTSGSVISHDTIEDNTIGAYCSTFRQFSQLVYASAPEVVALYAENTSGYLRGWIQDGSSIKYITLSAGSETAT